MTYLKKALAIVLMCALLSSFSACGQPIDSTPPAASSDSSSFDVASLNLDEPNLQYVQEALSLGIAWESLFDTSEVSGKDMAQLLKNANDKAYGQEEYKVLSFYLESAGDTAVTRMETAQMIFDAHLEYAFDLSPNSYTDFYAHTKIALQQENGFWGREPLSSTLIRTDDNTVVYYDGCNGPDAKEIHAVGDNLAVQFIANDYDRISDDKVMKLYEDNSFRPNQTIDPIEAVMIAYHYYRSLEPRPEYIPVAEVGTYNTDIITPKILGESSELPEASNAHLPAWKGFNKQFMATMMGSGDEGSMWVTEKEINAIADSGANFLRLWISFAWFEGPDYAGEDLVNTYYIEHLDSIIAWCIENDMHLQVSLVNMPGLDRSTLPEDEHSFTDRIYTDESYRDRCLEWYRMLARRYATLPNNCFSINLINEPQAPDDETYTEAFRPIVNAIWDESPNRLIVSDVHYNVTGEGMAEMGVALSYHTYTPDTFSVVNDSNRDYGSMKWPFQYITGSVYGPETMEWDGIPESYVESGNTFTGDIAGTWSIMLSYICNGDAKLCVVVDGETLYEGTPTNEPDVEGGTDAHATEPVVIEVPEGSRTVQLKCSMYRIGIDSIQIQREDGTRIGINGEINWEHFDAPSNVTINEDNSYTGGHVLDYQMILENEILPIKALADSYGVGFMVGEMGMQGPFFTDNVIPREQLQKYYTDMTSTLDEHGISFAFGALQGWYTLIMPYPYYEQYAYEKINDAVWVDKDMARFFRSLFSK